MQLGLGDPKNADYVAEQTGFMIDPASVGRFFNDIQGAPVDFESTYPIAEPVGAHAAAMDHRDLYVSVVTSLNGHFGSEAMSEHGGFVYNNALANFAIPGAGQRLTTANQMVQGHRPLTSAAVAVAMDTERLCGSRFAVGGANAGAVAEVMAGAVVFDADLKEAVDAARVLVAQDRVMLEEAYEGFGKQVADEFRNWYNGNITRMSLPYETVNSIEKVVDSVFPVADLRGGVPETPV